MDAEKALREEVEDLVSAGRLDLIIGYGNTYKGDGVRPMFVRKASDVGKLMWNDKCAYNLSTYLTKEPCLSIIRKGGKVGIVAKGCDVRSILTLIQEKQIGRESVYIIGMVCEGIRDERVAGTSVAFKCRACQWQVPPVYDELIGDTSAVKSIEGEPLEDIEAVRSLPEAERWKFWSDALSKCIKCYACREACPLCYCRECITEKSRPQWIDKSPSLRGSLAYHFIRAMHLAGRCISCGECSRGCPMDVPVDLLTRFLSSKVEEAFGYKPGTDPEAEPFFVTFKDDDPEDFIR